jgi:hypothetical protein
MLTWSVPVTQAKANNSPQRKRRKRKRRSPRHNSKTLTWKMKMGHLP